jgi:teichoic acid transport system permease protein
LSGASVTETVPAPAPSREDEFFGEHHIYQPHRVGLPPLIPYLREAWRRREFSVELSRTELRAQHFNTVFGMLWLVINPLLLACVYFILVDILKRRAGGIDYFAHLMAALFAFYFVSGAVRMAVKSVVSGQRLVLNTAFPRVLLPASSVISAFMKFVPTILVYVPVHLAIGLPVNWNLLWLFPIFLLFLIIATGLSLLVAALQVYFRDLKDFLSYALRVWVYATPILYYADDVPERYQAILYINPMAGLISAWSDVLDKGARPDHWALVAGAAWGIGLFVVGFLFFVSREREFAVRL